METGTLEVGTMPRASQTMIPFTPPMECLPVAKIPEGDASIYELKLDGYRAQARRGHGSEIGVACTKAFTAQLNPLFVLALHLAQVRGTISAD